MGGELPPDGFGLQLRGNRDDYYAPANSLLHKYEQTMAVFILCVRARWSVVLVSRVTTCLRLALQLRHPDVFVTCRVFETGLGIPISLSVIAVAVGRGAGLSMACVNAPGHFMAKLDPGGTAPVHYLDAFEGSIMDRWLWKRVLPLTPFSTALLARAAVGLDKKQCVYAQTMSSLF